MSYRLLFTITLALAALCTGQVLCAIDRDQLIDPANGRETEAAGDEPMTSIFAEGSGMGMAVTLLGYILIIGGLCVAGWYFFKRGGFRKTFSKSEGKLKVAETRMLGNRQFIMVVEYEDQKILLGVGPGKIDYLTSLNSYRGDFGSIEQAAGRSRGAAE